MRHPILAEAESTLRNRRLPATAQRQAAPPAGGPTSWSPSGHKVERGRAGGSSTLARAARRARRVRARRASTGWPARSAQAEIRYVPPGGRRRRTGGMSDGRTGASDRHGRRRERLRRGRQRPLRLRRAGRRARRAGHNLNRLDIDCVHADARGRVLPAPRRAARAPARPRARPVAAGARAARRRRRARPRRRARRCAPAHAPARRPPARPDRQAAAARVVHPARHERRDALGGDARARATSPRRARSSSATTPPRR